MSKGTNTEPSAEKLLGFLEEHIGFQKGVSMASVLYYKQGAGTVSVSVNPEQAFELATKSLELKPGLEFQEWWIESDFAGDPDVVPGVYVHRPSGPKRADTSRAPPFLLALRAKMLAKLAGFKVTYKL